MADILIVDDDDIIAELTSDILQAEGHSCQWVASGEDALCLLGAYVPDLVLLDSDMPGMSGPQMLRELRGSARHYALPVIMFTSASGELAEELALFNGAQDFLRKPFDPRALLDKVGPLLPRNKAEPDHPDRSSRSEPEAINFGMLRRCI